MDESRTTKSLLNARVSTIYYLIALFLSFFTRKIYIDYMGIEFMGLPSTLGSLLGFLSLAELGVGSAIGYTLYKPLARREYDEIEKIISIQGYIYSKVGYIILSLGILLSLLFPLIFRDTTLPFGVIYFAFYCYLANALLGYFINYPSIIFQADQRNYEITRYTQGATIVRFVTAAAVARWSGNFYLFVSLDLIFGAIAALIIQWRIHTLYPWLRSSIRCGKAYLKEYPSILKKTKQLFAHKIGELAQVQLSPIMIYAFSSLSVVTLYTNYMTLIAKLSLATFVVLGSTYASVGNLIAEGVRHRIKSIYFEMLSLRLCIAGYFIFMLYMLTDKFITLWLGSEYLLPRSILTIILVAQYVDYFKSATEQFISGYGLFHDVWASYVSAVLSIGISICGGYMYGLWGVLLGPAVSSILIQGIWKPYFLFSAGFKSSVRSYWRFFAKHILVYVAVCVATIYIHSRFPLTDCCDLVDLLLEGIYISALFLAAYLPILWCVDGSTRALCSRFINLIKRL